MGWAGRRALAPQGAAAGMQCRMPAPRLSGEESCQFGAVAPEPPRALLVPATAPVQTFNGMQLLNLGLPMKGIRLSVREPSAQTEPKACCLEDAISLLAQDPPARLRPAFPLATHPHAGATPGLALGGLGAACAPQHCGVQRGSGLDPASRAGSLGCSWPSVPARVCFGDRGPAAPLGPPGGRRCGGSQMGKAVPHGGSLKNCRLKVLQKSKRAFPALCLSLPPPLPPPNPNDDDILASRACAAWEADSGRGPCAHSPAPRWCSPRGPSGQGNAAPNSELALMQALALLSVFCLLL